MRKIPILIMLAAATMVFQGCHTTKAGICGICHPEEAAQAESSAPRQNPFRQLDNWIQEHMW